MELLGNNYCRILTRNGNTYVLGNTQKYSVQDQKMSGKVWSLRPKKEREIPQIGEFADLANL